MDREQSRGGGGSMTNKIKSLTFPYTRGPFNPFHAKIRLEWHQKFNIGLPMGKIMQQFSKERVEKYRDFTHLFGKIIMETVFFSERSDGFLFFFFSSRGYSSRLTR